MRKSRRSVLAAAGAAALASLARGRTAAPLVVGQVNLSFYAAAGAVVLGVLRRLGHGVTVIEAPHGEIYAKLASAEADVLVAAWLPHAHGPLHAPIADALVEAAVLYDDALLYWAVPAHVPADLVSSIDDLKHPEVLARMDRMIVGVGPGSGLMRGSEEILRRYGLAEHGYAVSVAPPAQWSGRLASASGEGRWMVMPLWRPHHLNVVHPVRPLVEPAGVFGVDRAVLVARRQVWERLPARSRAVLGRVRLDIASVTELDRQIVIEGLSPAAAAEAWLAANPQRVAGWFA